MARFRFGFKTHLVSNKRGCSLSVHRALRGTRNVQSDDYSKNDNNNQYYRLYKYLPAVILVAAQLFPQRALSETIGGVSATASPVANSSGSVTNQAIQVLQGPYITNTYGDGISCQGPTLNITPYVTRTKGWQLPYEPHYNDPVYDMSDLDSDGALDNPGDVLYYVPTRTGQKDSHNTSIGLSATVSFPLDGKAQALCKEAAENHNAFREQVLANKRLDFEIARLKNCGELMQKGIMFHPRSPFYKICADVVLVNPPGVIPPHRHKIPTSSPSSTQGSPDSTPSEQASSRALPGASVSYQASSLPSLSVSSQWASPPSEEYQQ